MKALHTSLLGCAIAAFAGTAFAASGIPVQSKPEVMPVVVRVNAQGKVTEILPSQHMTPRWRSLLRAQLDAWITKPATEKGKPVASAFIVEVAMQAKPRKDGKYDANFVYVKSLPMPVYGAVYWEHTNFPPQLALVGSNWFPATGPVLFRVDPPVNYWALQHRAQQQQQRENGNSQSAPGSNPRVATRQVRPAVQAVRQVQSMPAAPASRPFTATMTPRTETSSRPRIH
ncbi:MAG TPA: hypothetical protein VFW60_06330 [Rhodanobacteraceae bacterium]|nr:hypothetical protein [Rhodanobacteraceae bacterium]